jgi:hypothetical protein
LGLVARKEGGVIGDLIAWADGWRPVALRLEAGPATFILNGCVSIGVK